MKKTYKLLLGLFIFILSLFFLNVMNENNIYNVSNYVVYGHTYNDYNDVREVYIPEEINNKIFESKKILSNESSFCLQGTFDLEKKEYHITDVQVTKNECDGLTEMLITDSETCSIDRGVFDFEDDTLYSVTCLRDFGFFDSKSKSLSYEYYIIR